jgi:cyclopropane-fatty-acyl-phospholipid synthase
MKSSIIPSEAHEARADGVSARTRLARALLTGQLEKIRHGRLRIIEDGFDRSFGHPSEDAPFDITVRVRDPRFFADALFGGTVGAGQAYISGYWHCDNLTDLVRLFIVNDDMMAEVNSGWSRIAGVIMKGAHWLNRNDKDGSRRNVAAHYDVGNRFFELFLDETMAYSCGIFTHDGASLGEASRAKFDAACSKLALQPGHHLLEIGAGWGGFAIHAARHYGCRVTSTTISKQQYDYASERVAREGLADRITLLLADYRDLKGEYDALVSIEMVEAVGHQYLDTYFRTCSDLLRPNGAMLLQAITIADQFYARALRSVDYIQQFIFPGGFIPSVQSLVDSIARATDMKLFHLEDIGPHYARTLKLWREAFTAKLAEVRAQGYPESFTRMWEYYFCYCEGGFLERRLGDVQMLLTKPRARRATIATVHAAIT